LTPRCLCVCVRVGVVNEVVMRALVAGCCANFLNACLVGALL
jgi:nucleoside permease NupC